MKNRIRNIFVTGILVFSIACLSTVTSFADSAEEIYSAVYGDSLADIVLGQGYSWDVEDPAAVSVGDVGTNSFKALKINDIGEQESVNIEIIVEPAYISEVMVSADKENYYTGKPVIPDVEAYFKGTKLTENVDYKIICSDNINVGTAKVTVQGIGNFKGKTSFNFSINKKDVSGVTVTPVFAEVIVSKTVQLVADVLPEDATFRGVTWESSDEAVAKVDDTGLVTAVSEGNVDITVKTNDGAFSAVCAVSVIVHDEESDHNYIQKDVVESTCTTKGSATYMCCECDCVKTEELPLADHAFTDYKFNDDATCESDGTQTAVCDSGCGTENTIIAYGTAIGHPYAEFDLGTVSIDDVEAIKSAIQTLKELNPDDYSAEENQKHALLIEELYDMLNFINTVNRKYNSVLLDFLRFDRDRVTIYWENDINSFINRIDVLLMSDNLSSDQRAELNDCKAQALELIVTIHTANEYVSFRSFYFVYDSINWIIHQLFFRAVFK